MTVIRPRYLAVAAAAGLVLAATAGGVGYAAGSTSSNVSACVSSKGRLAVQNAKGKCPKKYKKVAIAKQGPRGATGAQGAKGAPGTNGARGPGAVRIDQVFLGFGTSTPVIVDGITYAPSCEFANGTTTAKLTITAPTGKTVTLSGIANDGPPAGAVTATAFATTAGASTVQTVNSNGGQSHVQWLPGALVLSGNTFHNVTLRILSNPDSGFLATRCSFAGVITPAA